MFIQKQSCLDVFLGDSQNWEMTIKRLAQGHKTNNSDDSNQDPLVLKQSTLQKAGIIEQHFMEMFNVQQLLSFTLCFR